MKLDFNMTKGRFVCSKFSGVLDVPGCRQWCIAFELCPETELCKYAVMEKKP
jgi:hypothetical protein